MISSIESQLLISRFRQGLLVALFSISFGSLRAEAQAVEGTMPEDYLPGLRPILQSALKQSPQMIISGITAAQAEATRIITDSRWYPALSGSTSYSIVTTSASSNPSSQVKSDGIYYSLTLSQSLFQFGAVKNQSVIARIGILIAEKNTSEAYRLLTTNLRLQYVTLVVKKATLVSTRFRVKINESALDVEEQKLKNGAISQGEIIGPRLALEESRLNLARAEQDYVNSCLLIAHLAGLTTIDETLIPDEISKLSFDPTIAAKLLNELQRVNAANTTASQISELSIRQADLTYKIAKVGLLPKFSASASTVLSNSATVVSGTVSQDAVRSNVLSITGTWSIFDGFATRGSKKSALASKRYYERLLQNQVQLTLDTAQNSEKALALSFRALELAETRTSLAEAAMNQVKKEFELGNRPQTSVDETTYAYLVSLSVLATYRADFLSRWSDFVSLVGSDPAVNSVFSKHGR